MTSIIENAVTQGKLRSSNLLLLLTCARGTASSNKVVTLGAQNMEFRLIIQRLNTVLPGWKHAIKTLKTASFASVRYRIERETLFDDAEVRAVLRTRLNDLHTQSGELLAALDALPDPALADRRVDFKEIKKRTNNLQDGWREWVAEQGYYFDPRREQWFQRRRP